MRKRLGRGEANFEQTIGGAVVVYRVGSTRFGDHTTIPWDRKFWISYRGSQRAGSRNLLLDVYKILGSIFSRRLDVSLDFDKISSGDGFGIWSRTDSSAVWQS